MTRSREAYRPENPDHVATADAGCVGCLVYAVITWLLSAWLGAM